MIKNRGPASGYSQKRWVYTETSEARCQDLAEGLGVSPLLARLLINRDQGTLEAAKQFLNPHLDQLNDPSMLSALAPAVKRIRQALYKGEKILVHGDYDVDGITGTALLYQFFRLLNANVTPFIPHRTKDGYSLQKKNMKRFYDEGFRVLITVDCGTTNVEEITYAQELGLDVIITDHHQPGPHRPPACAILNPKLDDNYPFDGLSGVGMTFKLAWGMAESMSDDRKLSTEMRNFLENALGLVALGTIADVAPLRDENRVLIALGLRAISHSQNPGFRALLEGSRLDDKDLSPTDIAFRIAPLINAAGRMGSAQVSLDLLVSKDLLEARNLESQLRTFNEARKEIEATIVEQARKQVEAMNLDETHAIVLADENWHPGVIGIVAARMAERFHRPSVVISILDGKGKGSGRSIPNLNLYNALNECADLFVSFGGHAQAAGFEIKPERIPELRQRLNEATARLMKTENMIPELNIDAQVDLRELQFQSVREIQRLAPFGEGNRKPILATLDLRVVGKPRIVGVRKNHLLFHVRKNDESFKAIAFNLADFAPRLLEKGRCHLAYTPIINHWNNQETVELEVRDIMIEE